MSSNSPSSIRSFGVSTYLVDQIQRFLPDEALDRFKNKINIIRNGIATMSSSAPSLYSSIPDPSPMIGFIINSNINRLMQGVDNVGIHVKGEATYTFPIFSPTCTLYNHRELLYIGEIKEYLLGQKAFTAKPEAVQLIISGLLISNYVCRILGVLIVAPVLFISAILGVKYPKMVGWTYAFMILHGLLLGPILRQLIEYMSNPTCSQTTKDPLITEMEKADEAIRQIEECELALNNILFQNILTFTEEGLQKLLETRRTHIDLLETFLKFADSQVSQQTVLWKIKARLKERNW